MPLSEEQIQNMQRKRRQILIAAATLFAEYGYEGTPVKKIAEAAGVSFGSVFTYFDNKETLFHSAVTEPLKEFEKLVEEIDPEAEDVLAELETMVSKHIRIYASMNEFLNLVTRVLTHYRKFPDTFKELDEFHERLRERVMELVVSGQNKGVLYEQDPGNVATVYTSLLMGMRLSLIDEPESSMWERLVPHVMQIFGPKH
ncbi:TetR/AcrR family transcriptional regulator [Alteribacter natronophilus]|uniref:TetR/AcrR family transcriptional regulator n=1 Tax=Alteribacter natronophilus TaxID=2583810 RepID=UPI00110DC6FF|nr:TetR/AcrR family transcriptional regulator [Alteribacter natronophilus]TMW70950.1 TetR/AcrR family transcriptional regulator [Alteribacter natronophilus]